MIIRCLKEDYYITKKWVIYPWSNMFLSTPFRRPIDTYIFIKNDTKSRRI